MIRCMGISVCTCTDLPYDPHGNCGARLVCVRWSFISERLRIIIRDMGSPCCLFCLCLRFGDSAGRSFCFRFCRARPTLSRSPSSSSLCRCASSPCPSIRCASCLGIASAPITRSASSPSTARTPSSRCPPAPTCCSASPSSPTGSIVISFSHTSKCNLSLQDRPTFVRRVNRFP